MRQLYEASPCELLSSAAKFKLMLGSSRSETTTYLKGKSLTCAELKKIYIKKIKKITPNLLLRIHQGWLVYLKKEEKKV